MRKLYFTFIALITFTCSHILAQDSYNSISPEHNDSSITIKTFKVQGGWGYDIYIKGTKYIHQKNIPAICNNKPFMTKKDAEETAKLVTTKLKNKISPPSVSINELDSIGIHR